MTGVFGLIAAVIIFFATRPSTDEASIQQEVQKEQAADLVDTPIDKDYLNPDAKLNPEAESKRVFLREKSPAELFAALEDLPPLQAETVIEKSYLGRWVRWSGKFYDASTTPFNSISVAIEWERYRRTISVEFDEVWRAEIEQLRKGDSVRFEAKIQMLFRSTVYLTDANFVKN